MSHYSAQQSHLTDFGRQTRVNEQGVRDAVSCWTFIYLVLAGGYTRLQGGRWSDSRALSCVERFDTFNQYWTTVSSLHQARSGLGVAVLEGMIYVVGGETAKNILCLCSNLQQSSLLQGLFFH